MQNLKKETLAILENDIVNHFQIQNYFIIDWDKSFLSSGVLNFVFNYKYNKNISLKSFVLFNKHNQKYECTVSLSYHRNLTSNELKIFDKEKRIPTLIDRYYKYLDQMQFNLDDAYDDLINKSERHFKTILNKGKAYQKYYYEYKFERSPFFKDDLIDIILRSLLFNLKDDIDKNELTCYLNKLKTSKVLDYEKSFIVDNLLNIESFLDINIVNCFKFAAKDDFFEFIDMNYKV